MGGFASHRDASPLRPVLGGPGRWRCTSRVHELTARGENPGRHRQESASASAHCAQILADANVCGILLPSTSFSRRTDPSPIWKLEGRRREVMITTLWHELQGQGFCGRDNSVWAFVRNWPLPIGMTPTSSSSSVAASTRRGAPATRTPSPREMAVVAQARGTECQGCGLSTSIVWSFPVPFVSLCTRPGLCAPDP